MIEMKQLGKDNVNIRFTLPYPPSSTLLVEEGVRGRRYKINHNQRVIINNTSSLTLSSTKSVEEGGYGRVNRIFTG